MEVSVSPYIARFAFAYTIALIAMGVILTVLDIGGSSSVSTAALFAGVVYAVSTFVQQEKRVPNPRERKKLMWLSLVASYVISLGLTVVVFAVLGELDSINGVYSLLSEVGVGILIGILLFVTLLYALVLWFAYGWFAKIQLNAMQKRGEI